MVIWLVQRYVTGGQDVPQNLIPSKKFTNPKKVFYSKAIASQISNYATTLHRQKPVFLATPITGKNHSSQLMTKRSPLNYILCSANIISSALREVALPPSPLLSINKKKCLSPLPPPPQKRRKEKRWGGGDLK